MQGYCVKGNCRDLSQGVGGKGNVKCFEGDLTEETPINLATTIFVHKSKHVIWM
jgi:hypothetical protein